MRGRVNKSIAIIGEGETEWFYFDSLRIAKRYPFRLVPGLPSDSDIGHILSLADKSIKEKFDYIICLIDRDRMKQVPADDLMNTSIHFQDKDFALQGGLMPQSEHSKICCNSGNPCKGVFMKFGYRIGVLPKKIDAIIKMFSTESLLINDLIDHSFLDDKKK